MFKTFSIYKVFYVDLMGNLTISVMADTIDIDDSDHGIKKINFYRDGMKVVYFPYGYVQQVSYWSDFDLDRVKIDM